MSVRTDHAPRPLCLIVEDMEDWAATGDGDPETAHLRADGLLVEAIERLSSYSTDTEDEGESVALLSAWNRVPKWYA